MNFVESLNIIVRNFLNAYYTLKFSHCVPLVFDCSTNEGLRAALTLLLKKKNMVLHFYLKIESKSKFSISNKIKNK